MGPYVIFQKFSMVAYESNIPSELASVHLVFHVSMIKNCIGHPVSILPIEVLGLKDNLS